jgi:hypothetical protein
MEEKGYRQVKQSNLPPDVSRQEPETSLHYRAVGISGELPKAP